MGTSRHPAGRGDSDECSMTAFQRVGVTARVTITPTVECGSISVTCLAGKVVPAGERHLYEWEPTRHGKCKLLVFQELCVAVPVTFGAHAECRLEEVFCGPASTDPQICLAPQCLESGGSSHDSSSDDTSGHSGSASDDAGSTGSSDSGHSD
jgi:hypothetical protein